MSSEFIQIKCPGCGATVSTSDECCEYCQKPVVIRNFNSVAAMSSVELNRYANSYKRELDANGENSALNKSLAMCYLKLKQYKKALEYFQKAMEDDFDDSENYFYAAVCLLEGKKAFLSMRNVIEQAETYLNDAISVEDRGVYYYFLAYVKYDYYYRKKFKTTPDYRECLQMSVQHHLTREDIRSLFEVLSVAIPDEINLL